MGFGALTRRHNRVRKIVVDALEAAYKTRDSMADASEKEKAEIMKTIMSLEKQLSRYTPVQPKGSGTGLFYGGRRTRRTRRTRRGKNGKN